MQLIYPSKKEIMEFFKIHSGYIDVYRISQLLVTPHVQRSTPVNEEWQHIQLFLHQLKSDNFLLIQNEGQDIYNEKFSSTPDRIEKYFNPAKKEEELLKLNPEFYGIGIDLKVLWRRIKKWFKL